MLDFTYDFEPLKIEIPEVEVPNIEPPKINIVIPPTDPNDLGQFYIDRWQRDFDDYIEGILSNVDNKINLNYGF